MPVGTDANAMERAMEIVENDGARQLARRLQRMPDNQSGILIATGSIVQRTSYFERVMDLELTLPVCQKVDNSAIWMLKKTCLLSRGWVHDEPIAVASPPTCAGEPVHGGWMIWAVVG